MNLTKDCYNTKHMNVSDNTNRLLHDKLPIDKDEKILAIYRHHWFAYVSTWVIGVALAALIVGVAVVLVKFLDPNGSLAASRGIILASACGLAGLVLVGTAVPAYLRSQEQLVLTEEALLQVLQPSLFASKIDQMGLQHVADVMVSQDFWGSIFGYGNLTVETPGEQNNYVFPMIGRAHECAREITAAHENFNAALQGGRMPSSLGDQESTKDLGQATTVQAQPTIDPRQYQEFLAYQRMVAQQRAEQQPSAGVGQQPPAGDQTAGVDSNRG